MSRVTQAYEAVAEQYVELFGAVDRVPAQDLEVIGRCLGPIAGPVVDLGCGPGHLTAFLASVHPDVTGIDRVPAFLAHARRAHPGVRFEEASLLELSTRMAGALAYYSLIHLPPAVVDRALERLHGLMDPGGVLVVGFFSWSVLEPFDHKVLTAYRWPVDALAGRLAAAGFVETERLERAVPGERPQALLVARVQ